MAFGVQALDAVASGAFVIRALECLTSLTAIIFGLGMLYTSMSYAIFVPLSKLLTRRYSFRLHDVSLIVVLVAPAST